MRRRALPTRTRDKHRARIVRLNTLLYELSTAEVWGLVVPLQDQPSLTHLNGDPEMLQLLLV